MSNIKEFFKDASIKFHMAFMCFLFVWLVVASWLCINVSLKIFFVLYAIFIFLFIFDTYYALHKTAEDYIYKYKRACFCEVEKILTYKYVRIYVFSSSKLDKSLKYYAKVDSDGTIFVYGKNKLGKHVFEHWTIDSIWFMNNFFTM